VVHPPVQEGHGEIGEGPEEAAKMVRDLEHSAMRGGSQAWVVW